MNKRGVTVLGIFGALFVVLMAAIFLGATAFTLTTVDNALSANITVGQVNLGTVHNQTAGLMYRGLLSNLDNIALVILFGLLLLMGVVGIGLGDDHPRVFFLVDAFLLVAVFIIGNYLADAFALVVSNPALGPSFTENLPLMSRFVLNLPIWATLTGLFIMVFTYGLSKKIKETQQQTGVQDVIGF